MRGVNSREQREERPVVSWVIGVVRRPPGLRQSGSLHHVEGHGRI
ncbi:hypothetical protein SNL152K_6928 [Streptomyces sp. NL15-2K]|nr:hypothetical protein SNL152K_6928 [Streptomyces sp. NL15-2K]